MQNKTDKIQEIANAFISLAKVDNRLLKFNCIVNLRELEQAKALLSVWSETDKNIVPRAIELINQEIRFARI